MLYPLRLFIHGQLELAGNACMLSTSTCTTTVPVRGAGEQRRCPRREKVLCLPFFVRPRGDSKTSKVVLYQSVRVVIGANVCVLHVPDPLHDRASIGIKNRGPNLNDVHRNTISSTTLRLHTGPVLALRIMNCDRRCGRNCRP